jgi:hypothetical protein
MAYCTFKEGDVHLYQAANDIRNCCNCRLTTPVKALDGKDVYVNKHFDTAAEALSHLEEHNKAGHNVPQQAIDKLKEEIQ